MQRTLDQFATDLHAEIENLAQIEDYESFREEQFIELMISYLSEAGEIDDGTVCFHKSRGMKVNGYNVSADGECLDLIVAVYGGNPEPGSVPQSEVSRAFKLVTTFFENSLTGYHTRLEESSPVFDLSLRIHNLAHEEDTLVRLRLFLVTDGLAKTGRLNSGEISGFPVSYHVWDIERLYRLLSSGDEREKIVIDFAGVDGGPVPCLSVPAADDRCTTYLAAIPGETLCALYAEHGPRLLERNVRSFLQARGKVNSGIRKTINEEPAMFLAYNNGISATADDVEIISLPDGIAIRSIDDLQIVNGGQTTASLYHAWRKDKADLSKITVQMKLNVIGDESLVEEVVPRICQFANSQNRVNTADFSANDPFHRKIEELSRTMWAPAVEGTHRQTRWFYERARGQFADAKGREGTPARRRAFEAMHPNSQKFTKTDLAKFENSWMQLPHHVSRGAQKNFQEFTIRLKERTAFEPDQEYFRHLAAKAILFRHIEKIVRSEGYPGYRANIVTYTLAWLSHATAQRIDLDLIWREQAVRPDLTAAIGTVAKAMYEVIIAPPSQGNVTEWCKQEKCWKACKSVEIDVQLKGEWLLSGRRKPTNVDKGTEAPNPKEAGDIARVKAVPPETWFTLAAWAKDTGNLNNWQRKFAYGIGTWLGGGREPTRKQARPACDILDEAQRLGFKP